MKRFLGVVAALLLLLAGIFLASLGGLGLAVFGTSGEFRAAGSDVTSSDQALALVADLAGVDTGIPYHHLLGQATLTVQSLDGSAVFVGRAEQSAVDDYLFGAPYDLATKDGTWLTTSVAGVETALAPPADQGFWTESSSGVDPTITLDAEGELQTLAVMNADASPKVAVSLALGFSGVRIFAFSVTAMVLGVGLVIAAITLAVRGKHKRSAAKSPDGSMVDLSSATPAARVSLFDDPAKKPAAVQTDDAVS